MIAVVSVAAVMLAAGAAQAAIVYQTGFEPTTYVTGNLSPQDGWQVWWGPEKFTVQNTTVKSGSQAVKAQIGGGGGNFRDTRYFASVLSVGATDILTLNYDQYLPAAWFAPFNMGSRALTVTLRPYYTDPEWNDPYNSIVLSTWGQYSNGYMQRIGFGVGASQLAVIFDQTVLADKWSNLRIVANNGTGSAEAFLNGGSLGTVAFTAGGITSVESIEIQASSPNSATAYVDNLSFSIVPEPATLALLVAGGAAIVASRRRRA
jgi:hypothetical protein